MDKLIAELMEILKSKTFEIDSMVDDPSDSSSAYATLEFEIQQVSDLVEYLYSHELYDDKIEYIKGVRFDTTSGSVYKVLGEYLTTEGQVKYYFVSFMYGASKKIPSNAVLHCHPIDWQIRCEKSHPGQYVLMHWQEITKEEYDRVEGVR